MALVLQDVANNKAFVQNVADSTMKPPSKSR